MQVGGYGGYQLFTGASPISWPSDWNVRIPIMMIIGRVFYCSIYFHVQVGTPGLYYATINTSSFVVQGDATAIKLQYIVNVTIVCISYLCSFFNALSIVLC